MESRKEFMQAYGLRSNVETTFHMIKARFGSRVRSRTMPAQENEILCKVLLHNLVCAAKAYFEHGIDIHLA